MDKLERQYAALDAMLKRTETGHGWDLLGGATLIHSDTGWWHLSAPTSDYQWTQTPLEPIGVMKLAWQSARELSDSHSVALYMAFR